MLNGLRQDLRDARRALTGTPGLTALSLATLAIGIGGGTAIFSVIEAVLLRPLTYREPARLVSLGERDKDGSSSNTSYATYSDWRARNRTLEDVCVTSYWTGTLTSDGQAEKVVGLRVSDGFFRLLGVRPAQGRDFLPEESRRGNHLVVLLTDGLWRRRFGADPGIVGRPLPINGVPYRVVGVLPAGFEPLLSTFLDRPAEVYAPLGYDATLPYACRTCRHLRAVGRLAPGATLEAARRDMDSLSEALVREHPTEYADAGVVVRPLLAQLTRDVSPSLRVLFGAVVLVLLIACVNVANLELGRVERTRAELAMRTALGASRGRLVRMGLVRSLALAVGGGLLGCLLAYWGLGFLLSRAPADIPRIQEVSLDVSVLLFTLGVSVLCGLGFGLVPALRASSRAPRLALAGLGTTTPASRLPGVLVAAEVALTFVLLVGAGLLLGSLHRLVSVDPGFSADRVLTAEVTLPGARYAEAGRVSAFYAALLDRLAAQPGVTAVGVVSQLPLGGDMDRYGMHVEGVPEPNPEDVPSADRYAISPGYLRAMGIPLLRGRAFDARDRAGAPAVALVSQTFAERFWPGQEPLGRRIKLGDPAGPWREVVGVVGDVLHQGLDAPRTLQLYLPHPQWTDTDMLLAVRTSGPPALVAPALRRAVAALDPEVPLSSLRTMEDVVDASVARRSFAALLIALFAVVAVVLAAVGIFGVLSDAIGRKAREIGIRVALGATPRHVIAFVGRTGLAPAGIGAAAGALVAYGVGPLLASLLFRVSPHEPVVYLVVTAVVVSVTLVAAGLPARRATRVDPVVVLRSE
jgi:putative ABC transport system permease protein